MKKSRILIKISGEVLMGKKKYGHDVDVVEQICKNIKEVYKSGYEICIVVGGGNIFRGNKYEEMRIEKVSADYAGMIATVINGIILQDKLSKGGLITKLIANNNINNVVEKYIREKTISSLKKGKIIIFVEGISNPCFSTDTNAVIKAIEMNCSLLLKGTNVDGVYSEDPKVSKNIKKYKKINYNDIITKEINIMDQTAIILAKKHSIPVKVFDISKNLELNRVLLNKGSFTLIN